MFIEKSVELFYDSLILNDGFFRNPSLTNTYKFSAKSFFNTVSNTGNLYKYQVEIPTVNLIKLHGSLNWQVCDEELYQSLEYIKDNNQKDDITFIQQFALILPRKDKFNKTVTKQIYYDLLRIYSNELDKENTLLISEGFSFADEHIFDITKRALKNPTLLLVIFCYQKDELKDFQEKFATFNNVYVVYSEKENIDFNNFNQLITEVLPKGEEKPIDTYKTEEATITEEPKNE